MYLFTTIYKQRYKQINIKNKKEQDLILKLFYVFIYFYIFKINKSTKATIYLYY